MPEAAKPKFEAGDMVRFTFEGENGKESRKGVVYVVDPFGTEEQPGEPSYDIYALDPDGEKRLYKHLRQSVVEKVSPDQWLNEEN